jgi:hypothetical protein
LVIQTNKTKNGQHNNGDQNMQFKRINKKEAENAGVD